MPEELRTNGGCTEKQKHAWDIIWFSFMAVVNHPMIMRELSNEPSRHKPGRRSCQGRMLLISRQGIKSIRQNDREGATLLRKMATCKVWMQFKFSSLICAAFPEHLRHLKIVSYINNATNIGITTRKELAESKTVWSLSAFYFILLTLSHCVFLHLVHLMGYLWGRLWGYFSAESSQSIS